MFADPAKNISYLQLEPGMKVADFGVGSGEYSFAAARALGASGRVFAIDIQKELVDKVVNEAKGRHLPAAVDGLWGDVETRGGAKLADGAVDAVILSNILFQVDSPYGLALEVKRVLRPGGKVLVIDWQDSYGGIGPPPDRVILPAKAEEVMLAAGFIKDNAFAAGAHHYGLVFHI